ncbi:hypothetical protein JCGZ_07850 [Jatropha curcas]|uniref:Uncharacterized protein n=1 Tax=Jatropha curcas TaxID=180498 RepID=A0A067KZH0_JATCU|nr:hypothetical protein JCGZ_07850 [Jatropha curcas]
MTLSVAPTSLHRATAAASLFLSLSRSLLGNPATPTALLRSPLSLVIPVNGATSLLDRRERQRQFCLSTFGAHFDFSTNLAWSGDFGEHHCLRPDFKQR